MKNITSTPFHKIIFIGDSSVGKTSIINQYIYNSCTPQYNSTIGIDYLSKIVNEADKPIQLQIWDTAGQEKFHSLIPAYIRSSTIAVLVYDITCKQSFDNIQTWYQMVINNAEPAFIIVGNKSDLDSERANSIEEGKKFANQINAKFIETSAITSENISQLFDIIIQIPIPVEEVAQEEKQVMITIPSDKMDTKAPQNNGCGC
ncbi:Ras family protein [Trichomonas vaginalis G3]|uniref:Ras family protein n=2 Tax=Trichomonas vaginalis TaxID=5722 RepID=A0A8U0WPH6_TRIV3|nr:small Rab GTPase Rab6a [Trichomonas vaginalis G3]AAX97451.1 small Rab GTPase Rab6a [Trichomonas vaginalis]EAY17053.1 Ras family protein [Trichomonas vaginalis G3]KAI5517923.1 small Rab GTPase Rab6a [Trichomonas vaginalis G3]|eukprot:XP_001329276.1 Ras family protein [Trichomonas vaginalis G3]